MEAKKPEESSLVFCTVEKIIGTTVFTKLDDYNISGTLSFPEVAPGRIRNIRDYAFPGKKIICKILKVYPDHVELSLRRVKTNEKNDFNENSKKEKSYFAYLKNNIQGDLNILLQKIKENESSLVNLFEKAKENPSIFDKYFKKEDSEKIKKMLSEKKQKDEIVSSQFTLSTKSSDGIVKIKEILKKAKENCKECDFSYIAAGKYLARIKSKELKQAGQGLTKTLALIETLAKKNNCEFNVSN